MRVPRAIARSCRCHRCGHQPARARAQVDRVIFGALLVNRVTHAFASVKLGSQPSYGSASIYGNAAKPGVTLATVIGVTLTDIAAFQKAERKHIKQGVVLPATQLLTEVPALQPEATMLLLGLPLTSSQLFNIEKSELMKVCAHPGNNAYAHAQRAARTRTRVTRTRPVRWCWQGGWMVVVSWRPAAWQVLKEEPGFEALERQPAVERPAGVEGSSMLAAGLSCGTDGASLYSLLQMEVAAEAKAAEPKGATADAGPDDGPKENAKGAEVHAVSAQGGGGNGSVELQAAAGDLASGVQAGEGKGGEQAEIEGVVPGEDAEEGEADGPAAKSRTGRCAAAHATLRSSRPGHTNGRLIKPRLAPRKSRSTASGAHTLSGTRTTSTTCRTCSSSSSCGATLRACGGTWRRRGSSSSSVGATVGAPTATTAPKRTERCRAPRAARNLASSRGRVGKAGADLRVPAVSCPSGALRTVTAQAAAHGRSVLGDG